METMVNDEAGTSARIETPAIAVSFKGPPSLLLHHFSHRTSTCGRSTKLRGLRSDNMSAAPRTHHHKSLKANHPRQINVKPGPQPEASAAEALANGLICPFSWKRFTAPVIAPNGVTYNADALYPYIEEHGHLPTDCRPITPGRIWPDPNMRDRLSANLLDDQDDHLEDPSSTTS